MKTKKIPMRKCVGCMESKPKRELIRIVAAEGVPKIDLTGKANGRGIYLCPNTECFSKAKKKKSNRERFGNRNCRSGFKSVI